MLRRPPSAEGGMAERILGVAPFAGGALQCTASVQHLDSGVHILGGPNASTVSRGQTAFIGQPQNGMCSP